MSGLFDPAPALAGLKDFQRRTVDYVFRRLYEDEAATRRFLVADEVGLGKTMVARGIIARAIRRLQEDPAIRRIDIVYVCSNAAIARQNVNRLNVMGAADLALATRLTLLPLELKDLDRREISFVSFTPGTTFDLKSSTGIVKERALIYRMLFDQLDLRPSGLRNLLQGVSSGSAGTGGSTASSSPSTSTPACSGTSCARCAAIEPCTRTSRGPAISSTSIGPNGPSTTARCAGALSAACAAGLPPFAWVPWSRTWSSWTSSSASRTCWGARPRPRSWRSP
jgi:hypothetical protein